METTNVKVEYHLAEADRNLIQGFISAVDYLRGERPERPVSEKDLLGTIYKKAAEGRILIDQYESSHEI